MRISAFVLSCPARHDILRNTLHSLSGSGWDAFPPEIVLDEGNESTPLARIHVNWRKMVRLASHCDADFALLLEDDLTFGRWFTRNLQSWPLLREMAPQGPFYASLYNPGHPLITRRETECYAVADPRWLWGSQALLVSTRTLRYIDRNWDNASGNPDQRMPLLVRAITPIYYHVPSLVDHVPARTTWGGIRHKAIDFDPEWQSPNAALSAQGGHNALDDR